jgi:predicted nuclease of predicted toxin-antitoxin system
MRFLIDRCAGRLIADWLRKQGHDVVESRELDPDPGDRALLDRAAKETRILVTIDTDFGEQNTLKVFRTLVSSAYRMFPPANAS